MEWEGHNSSLQPAGHHRCHWGAEQDQWPPASVHTLQAWPPAMDVQTDQLYKDELLEKDWAVLSWALLKYSIQPTIKLISSNSLCSLTWPQIKGPPSQRLSQNSAPSWMWISVWMKMVKKNSCWRRGEESCRVSGRSLHEIKIDNNRTDIW